jgi:phospholipid/cholesterol/gamma-HCH transport system ATP-binding protein
MVFQSAALFDSLTVYENVAFGLREHREWPEARIAERVRECLAAVGLRGVEALRPAELSGGMRKRVGVARGIALEPRAILYDEPTTGLDPITAITIDDEIIKLRDLEAVSSIIVTHQLRDAFYIATHTAVRHDGRVIIREAIEEKREEAEFLMLHEGRVAFEGTAAQLRGSKDSYLRTFLS